MARRRAVQPPALRIPDTVPPLPDEGADMDAYLAAIPESSVVGLPAGLTRDRVARLARAMRRGHTLAHAASLAGLYRVTVANWFREGLTGDPLSPLHAFALLLQYCEALAVDASLQQLRMSTDWKAHGAFLSRRHRDSYGIAQAASTLTDGGRPGVVVQIGIALPGSGHTLMAGDASAIEIPALPGRE